MQVMDAIANCDLAEPYQVLRSNGSFVNGGYEEIETTLNLWGVVSNVSAEELSQTPDADRVTGARGFHCLQQLFRTHDDSQGTGTSDIIVYKGTQYRVLAVLPYANRGYWKAIAVRMAGD